MTEADAGYITINPAVAHHKFNVVIMKPAPIGVDEYVVFRISQPLSPEAALNLARSWAAATRLEIR
jgi:hypothetical protein